MAFRKRTSKVIEQAQIRSDGLGTIDADLDLGNNLTLTNYDQQIAQTQAALDAYNKALAAADAAANALQNAEEQLGDLSERMLVGVAAKYGKDSYEYEMAGGTRKSDRKRPVRKAAPIAL